jgi:hypothetical protein
MSLLRGHALRPLPRNRIAHTTRSKCESGGRAESSTRARTGSVGPKHPDGTTTSFYPVEEGGSCMHARPGRR